jgi:uncharacterized membrane protein
VRSRTLLPGALVGLGAGGILDGVVLFQLLHWHHVYDRSSLATGLVTDGLFYLGAVAALVAGLVLLWRRRVPALDRSFAGAALTAAGALNLVDGVVVHKLLRWHQVREHVHETPYDVGYILLAAVLLVAGLTLLRRSDVGMARKGDLQGRRGL